MHVLGMQIGGVRAPSPVGDLGNVEMTQALPLAEAAWQPVGPDMLLSGALPQLPPPQHAHRYWMQLSCSWLSCIC